ncbi:uncharacterized protein LOC126381497 [Pectinophora gossypiella]|uniref:uncharacterized protein LOC126381497 n=1 Tax=Pectinophora gossypiella TaxID=13191 RepID=UPI00214E7D6E|nr:uncharacterized protein LOC126381497 [Pectinophora gossypiella]
MLDDTLTTPVKARTNAPTPPPRKHKSPQKTGQEPEQPGSKEEVDQSASTKVQGPPEVAIARKDAYSIVISTTPGKGEEDTEEDYAGPIPAVNPVLEDYKWEESSNGSQWTDVDSQPTGRLSLLPSIGTHTGVSKDLATQRAREYLLVGKGALESSKTLKRELRATAVECLGNLYELVLSLADSRNRHRLNLEVERSRAARELVRVERAHHVEMQRLREDFDKRLQTTQETLKETQGLAEGIQSWLNSEVGGLISTVKTSRREETPRALPPPPTYIQSSVDHTKELAEISDKLTSLATEIFYIKQDRSPKKHGSQTPSASPTSRPETDPLQQSLASLRTEMEASRKEIALIKKGISDLKCATREEVREELSTATAPIHKKASKLLEEVSEVKDVVLANGGLQASGAMGLGTELAMTDTTATIEGLLNPLKADVAEIASTSKALTTSMQWFNSKLKTPETTTARTYAETLKCKPKPRPNHTLIVSSTDPTKTGDGVLDTIRTTLDFKSSGLRVDRVRKARNSKIVLSCESPEDARLLQQKIKTAATLKVKEAKAAHPLIKVKNLMAYHTDDELCQNLRAQNKELFEGLKGEDASLKVRYRKRARNNLQCHPVLEVAPKLHKRILEAGHVHIGLEKRPVEDQSPLVQCAKCLGFGHTKALCKERDQACNYCGDSHSWQDCPVRKQGGEPKCRNCMKAQKGATNNNKAHMAFSDECPERAVWDGIARAKIAYC